MTTKSKERLKVAIKNEITVLFERALDYSQVACPPDTFKALRSRILRIGNDCIRDLHKVVDRDYDVEYKASNEDIIEIRNVARKN